MRRIGVVLTLALLAGSFAVVPASADHDGVPEPVVPIYNMYFPVSGDNHYTDTWHAPRSGGRVHLGTDIMADKMVPIVAVAAGTVGWMHNELGGNCCDMELNHDDGWSTTYIHMNNDTPGTDDGLGWGFADGIARGVHVEAGQIIGWVGDSGNAELAGSHLHFELYHPEYGAINPYPHLQAATGLAEPFLGPDKPPCSDEAVCDTVAFVSSGAGYYLHRNVARSADVDVFFYGNPGDVPLMGDWNCDGVATPAMYRPENGFMYLRNSNTQGIADVDYFYGDPGDIPLAGDFNGDGCDTLAIYRQDEGKVYIKNSIGTGIADIDYFFGNPGDKPFVGDFDGDGIDTIGLHREDTGFVYFSNSHSAGAAESEFFYGDAGDKILAGDWDGDGDDTVAVYRPSTEMLYVKLTNEQGVADYSVGVGEFAAALVAGRDEPLTEEPPPEA